MPPSLIFFVYLPSFPESYFQRDAYNKYSITEPWMMTNKSNIFGTSEYRSIVSLLLPVKRFYNPGYFILFKQSIDKRDITYIMLKMASRPQNINLIKFYIMIM